MSQSSSLEGGFESGWIVTWSRGMMSRMSGILIMSYRLKEVTNSYVLHCFWTSKNVHNSATRCPIEMGFVSKCSILDRHQGILKNQNWLLLTCESFSLVMSHFFFFFCSRLSYPISFYCYLSQGCKFLGNCLNSGFHEVQIPALLFIFSLFWRILAQIYTLFQAFQAFSFRSAYIPVLVHRFSFSVKFICVAIRQTISLRWWISWFISACESAQCM